jgi:nuclear pore complex protein Nup210
MFLFAGLSYSRCDYFNAFIRWSLLSENQTFEFVDTTEALGAEAFKHHTGSWTQYGNPCAWISLNAAAAGRATVVATFSSESESYLETFNVPILLKATSKVSAYYPLLALQAGNGNQFGGYWVDLSRLQSEIQNVGDNSPKELYLVPGSTMNVFLYGGPEPWDKVVDFVETVDVVGEPKSYITGSTAVQKISSGLYQVSCQSEGSFVSISMFKLSNSIDSCQLCSHIFPVMHYYRLLSVDSVLMHCLLAEYFLYSFRRNCCSHVET